MRRPSRGAIVLATAVACAGVTCTRPDPDVRSFPLTGVVVGQEPAASRVVIAHDAVEGLMPAMSMGFEVGEGAPRLLEGDRIAATLQVSSSRSWLEKLRITGRDPNAARVATATRAMPGAGVPDAVLVDQDGAPAPLRDAAGRIRVVTFIYTRCPMPELCPLMVRHLEAVRLRANAAGLGDRLSFLGLTLDPAFDTPAILRSYGESVLRGDDRFGQWTLATGTAAQVEDVARFFGVGYRADGQSLVHTLVTAVISHDGRVVRTFASNSWRPEELYDVVQQSIERAPR